MTFKELEWKKVKELISPFAESWMTNTFSASAMFYGYVLFSYFGNGNMCVHYISDFHTDTKSVDKNIPIINEAVLFLKSLIEKKRIEKANEDFK